MQWTCYPCRGDSEENFGVRHGLGDPRTPENHPKDAVDLRDEDLDVFGEGQDDELGQLWMKYGQYGHQKNPEDMLDLINTISDEQLV